MAKMKNTHLSIDMNILEQMLSMSIDDMCELVTTVGIAVSLNNELAKVPQDKITIGLMMLKYANTILEHCDCHIESKINNQTWTRHIEYTTGINQQEEPS